jgi:molecular chaperone DnaK
LTDPENVAVEFKRWLGQKDRKSFPAAHRQLSAEELSAEILKSLREDVRRQAETDVTSAVITVPAAFGALQCEATARATTLAGLEGAPLLQEPIAAAIGYGIRPASENQRWLVFDLGGGTLDIAVVSTRAGRLNVLEHRGNNLLGGKDIDRLIVEHLFLPKLQESFDLPPTGAPTPRTKLLRRLGTKAEEAKIDLSREDHILVPLFDIGEDNAGERIEAEIPITRSDLNRLMEPLLEKCCLMALEALAEARLATLDLDRILLVGGPTQSPFLRNFLSERLGVPVDFSADPMTVVGRGAAVYAATLEKTKASVSVTNVGAVGIKLAFESVSAEAQCAVAGVISTGETGIEIKFDADGGHWTSGWMTPVNGFFEAVVSLNPADITTFWIYARDAHGRLLTTDTTEFRIRHGLVPSAPPLPRTLSFEILTKEGIAALDPVFIKGTPLPAQKTVRYRAAHALSPEKPGVDLAIKLWEGEFLNDAETNEWVGNLALPHDGIKRALPEGAEIHVTIDINSSRLINVAAFVPILNQHFTNHVYLPQREEQDFSELSRKAVDEVNHYKERVNQLEHHSANNLDVAAEITELRKEIESLAAWAPASKSPGSLTPDDARRIVEDSKSIRGRLGKVERKVIPKDDGVQAVRFAEEVELAEAVVQEFGSPLDKQQLVSYKRDLERVGLRADDKGIAHLTQEIAQLRWRILFKQDWYWREILEGLAEPGTPFLDQSQAHVLISKGRTAASSGDGESLREPVRNLWKLQPKRLGDEARDRSISSGLRKF